MGLVVDSGVLIRAERTRGRINFDRWAEHGEAYISAITFSELLVGVHKATTVERRIQRAAFVEGLLAVLPVLDFDIDTARVHSQVLAALSKSVTIGAHDLIIGATALRHGFALLTTNTREFLRMPGLTVLNFH